MYHTFFSVASCHMLLWNVDVLSYACISTFFLAKHDRFRISKFCVWHKIMFVQRNVLCLTAIIVRAVRIHKPPLRALGTHQHSSLQSIYHLCPLHAAAFEDTPQLWPSCLHLLQGDFCFARSAPLFMDLLEFTFIEFNFFLSFSSATSAVALADANLSANNSTAQSFSMSNFTVCVLVGMISHTSLKLYSVPSVNKIRPVSVFSLCFTKLWFRSTNSFCSLATCVLISSLQSRCT